MTYNNAYSSCCLKKKLTCYLYNNCSKSEMHFKTYNHYSLRHARLLTYNNEYVPFHESMSWHVALTTIVIIIYKSIKLRLSAIFKLTQ